VIVSFTIHDLALGDPSTAVVSTVVIEESIASSSLNIAYSLSSSNDIINTAINAEIISFINKLENEKRLL